MPTYKQDSMSLQGGSYNETTPCWSKRDIRHCKSVPLYVRFQIENYLQEFVKSKKITQEAYEYEHLYAQNVSHFEGNVLKHEEKAQEMQNLKTRSSGKRKKKTNNG